MEEECAPKEEEKCEEKVEMVCKTVEKQACTSIVEKVSKDFLLVYKPTNTGVFHTIRGCVPGSGD